MPDDIRLFHTISRTHSYWGRKPVSGLLDIFSEVAGNGVVVDPFCGGGTPALAALLSGARVIAGDLNPMAVFLTKTLLRPLEVSSLSSAFEMVKRKVAEEIQNRYLVTCPTCKTTVPANSFIWEGYGESARPVGFRAKCPECRKWVTGELKGSVRKRIFESSSETPKHWYPKTRISATTRQPPVTYHHQLFTGRNLAALAELRAAIEKVQPESHRAALLYVFTGMLYSCSTMQMYSGKTPGSSQGWTALRYYVPKQRMEKNVWQVFENRFRTFMACKRSLNIRLPAIHIAENIADFNDYNCEALIERRDVRSVGEVLGGDVRCVFLDPPYSADVDYLGLSDFWGGWLKYRGTSRAGEILPAMMQPEDYFGRVTAILKDIRSRTAPDTDVRLAFGSKTPKAALLLENAIGDAGYRLAGRARHSVLHLVGKSGAGSGPLSTGNAGGARAESSAVVTEAATSFLRATAVISRAKGFRAGNRTVYNLAEKAVPSRLRAAFDGLPRSGSGLGRILSDTTANQRDYHSMCLDLLSIILEKDGGRLDWLNERLFSPHHHTLISKNADVPALCSGAALRAVKNRRSLVFCFDDQDEGVRRRVAKRIMKHDADKFETIAVLIVGSEQRMNELRTVKSADAWSRGFFTTFDELRRKALLLDKKRTLAICSFPDNHTAGGSSPDGSIAAMQAKVVEQVLVGKGRSRHYKLKFKVNSLLHTVYPGQFVMVSAWKGSSAGSAPSAGKAVSMNRKSPPAPASPSSEPEPYLKRPFGIHRAFYRYFRKDYLKHLCLPHALATVLHTVFPDEFDIFYKVLDNGIGTHALSKLHKGADIEVMGPLGNRNRFNLREELDGSTIREIHVIGGGVGMAPLVFFVQALRYLSFTVKAFVGLESLDMLPIAANSAEANDAHIFIDDLMDAGLNADDIHISSDVESDVIAKTRKHRIGYISESYAHYLTHDWSGRNAIALTCGPEPMMQAVAKIAKSNGIKLYVLMEKRMACGIGVCFSCVCKKHSGDGTSHNSRVCLDGPLYSAEEIFGDN